MGNKPAKAAKNRIPRSGGIDSTRPKKKKDRLGAGKGAGKSPDQEKYASRGGSPEDQGHTLVEDEESSDEELEEDLSYLTPWERELVCKYGDAFGDIPRPWLLTCIRSYSNDLGTGIYLDLDKKIHAERKEALENPSPTPLTGLNLRSPRNPDASVGANANMNKKVVPSTVPLSRFDQEAADLAFARQLQQEENARVAREQELRRLKDPQALEKKSIEMRIVNKLHSLRGCNSMSRNQQLRLLDLQFPLVR